MFMRKYLMMFKYLSFIPFFLSAQFAVAQNSLATDYTANLPAMDEVVAESPAADGTPAVLPSTLMPLAPFGGGSGGNSDKNFCIGINVGMDNMAAQFGNYSATGTGFGHQYSAGLAIQREGKTDGHQNAISIMLSYTIMQAKMEYTDKTNNTIKPDYKMYGLGLPVSYTGIANGRSAVGFFYQAGIDFEYLSKVYDTKQDVSKNFNKFLVAPFASFGIAFRNEISSGEFKSEHIMLGPFISYDVNNLTSVSGNSLSNYTFGLRLYVMQVD